MGGIRKKREKVEFYKQHRLNSGIFAEESLKNSKGIQQLQKTFNVLSTIDFVLTIESTSINGFGLNVVPMTADVGCGSPTGTKIASQVSKQKEKLFIKLYAFK